jgi:hypothetical protein
VTGPGSATQHNADTPAQLPLRPIEPKDPADGNATTLSKIGYTNLEMYLNELAGDLN